MQQRRVSLQCKMTDMGYGSGSPSRLKQGGLWTEPPAFGDFYNFLLKITHF